jgi:phosphomevalonate kinase
VRTTLRGSPVVAAPGKVFLAGEYGVLDGGTAVLVAVDRRAVGQFIPELDDGSPLVAEAVRATRAALGDKAAALPAGSVWIDSGAFSAEGDGRKLGLGSSAATAACAVGAVLEMAGLPVATHRDLAFSLAESAHRAWQGGLGSGADVAAAVHGGVLQYSRPGGGGAPVVRRIARALDGLSLVVFSSGTAAATTQQIRGVRAFAASAPERYAALLAPIRAAADRFVESIVDMPGARPGTLGARARETLAATRAAGDAMAALGQAAGVPIVTPVFARAAELAAELGGAAKPSGAGGGDVGIALFGDGDGGAAAALEFAARVRAESHLGLEILKLTIDENGLHRRTASPAKTKEQHV